MLRADGGGLTCYWVKWMKKGELVSNRPLDGVMVIQGPWGQGDNAGETVDPEKHAAVVAA